MRKPGRKQQDKRRSDMEKVNMYAEKYSKVYFIEHADIPNKSVQELRDKIDGKLLFVKKSMFYKVYPQIKTLQESFFLLFSNEDVQEILTQQFVYPTFVRENDVVEEEVVIPAGEVKNQELAHVLEKTEDKAAKVFLKEELVVCEPGTKIDSKQERILKLLGKRLKKMHLNILDVKDTGELKGTKSK